VQITSVSSSVHRFQVTIALIDEPIEERKVVVCRTQPDGGLTGPGLWQADTTPDRNIPDPQANVARLPTAPRPGFACDAAVFKERLTNDQGG
jgi:hypothetical protein